MRTIAGFLLLTFVAVACGAEEPAATSTTAGSPVGSTATQAIATSTTITTIVEETTTTASEIDVEFSVGEVYGADVIAFDLGDRVDVWVLSDVDDEMHVHGYDLYYDLVAGEPFHLDFVADVPGIFEVEIHTGHTPLFELEVKG